MDLTGRIENLYRDYKTGKKYDYVYSNTKGSLEKTGRHFDEIEQLLDKMKE